MAGRNLKTGKKRKTTKKVKTVKKFKSTKEAHDHFMKGRKLFYEKKKFKKASPAQIKKIEKMLGLDQFLVGGISKIDKAPGVMIKKTKNGFNVGVMVRNGALVSMGDIYLDNIIEHQFTLKKAVDANKWLLVRRMKYNHPNFVVKHRKRERENLRPQAAKAKKPTRIADPVAFFKKHLKIKKAKKK